MKAATGMNQAGQITHRPTPLHGDQGTLKMFFVLYRSLPQVLASYLKVLQRLLSRPTIVLRYLIMDGVLAVCLGGAIFLGSVK